MNTFKTFALVTAVAAAPALFAQTAPTVNDPAAKTILDDLSKTTKAYTTIKADFTVLTVKPNKGGTETQDGSIQLKDKKYKVTLKGDEIINDGTTSWNYSKNTNEVTIDNAKAKPGKMTPDQLFNFYEKEFKYKYIKEEMQSGSPMQIIELYPIKPDGKTYTIVKLTIDKNKKQVKSAEFKNRDGSTTTYTIKTFVPNGTMDDTIFQFDKKAHVGVKEVNLKDDED